MQYYLKSADTDLFCKGMVSGDGFYMTLMLKCSITGYSSPRMYSEESNSTKSWFWAAIVRCSSIWKGKVLGYYYGSLVYIDMNKETYKTNKYGGESLR